MARPERRDVDYFPFYVKDGKTLFILESQYGCKGTGFFTNVLRFLCQTPDHHYQIKDESDRLFFFSRCHCDEVSGAGMLEVMLKTGKLSRKLWETAGVIASEDLLTSIEDAYRKRNNKIITIQEIEAKYITSGDNQVNGADNPTLREGLPDDSEADNPQSKVKESKVKKRKKSIVRYDYEKNTWEGITDEMIARWVDRFPALDIQQELNKMATWLDTHRKNKKTDFDKFIGNWLIRNQDRAKPQQSTDTLGGFRD